MSLYVKNYTVTLSDDFVLATIKVFRVILINQLSWNKFTDLHPAIVENNTGSDKSVRKVMESNLFVIVGSLLTPCLKVFLKNMLFTLADLGGISFFSQPTNTLHEPSFSLGAVHFS